MKEWTDVDYAQAAIDMLPENKNDIVTFLEKAKVRWGSRGGDSCPIAQWVNKWTDETVWVTTYRVTLMGGFMPLPFHISQFIYAYDYNMLFRP